MQLILITQYFDMLKEVGAASRTNTIMVPHTPGGLADIMGQIRDTIVMGNAISHSHTEHDSHAPHGRSAVRPRVPETGRVAEAGRVSETPKVPETGRISEPPEPPQLGPASVPHLTMPDLQAAPAEQSLAQVPGRRRDGRGGE